MLLTGQINDEYIYSSIYFYINTLCIFEIFHCNFFFFQKHQQATQRGQKTIELHYLIELLSGSSLNLLVYLFWQCMQLGGSKFKTRIKPAPPAAEAWSLNYWITRESPRELFEAFHLYLWFPSVVPRPAASPALRSSFSFNKVWVFPLLCCLMSI